MKYLFSTTDNGVYIEISSNVASIRNTVDYNNCEPIDKTIRYMIDNMRLTVNEREEALADYNMFKEYLHDNIVKKTTMINE